VEKLEEKRPVGRPRRSWVDNIEIDHGEMEWGCMGWIYLASYRDYWRAVVNMVINFWVLQTDWKFLSS
jgi:hypothetical protein